jgi:hypothetical protein
MDITFRVCILPEEEPPIEELLPEFPDVELPELVPELDIPLLEFPEFISLEVLELDDPIVPLTCISWPTWSASLAVSPVSW